uniref:Phospholipase-like protein n=1 Tax=Tanacetum cinerariifolium TaxID=118510 RepID=A0A6L2L0X2_TANCI|nr:phospholipase-like protein [Tanacetum cinerariifolium]
MEDSTRYAKEENKINIEDLLEEDKDYDLKKISFLIELVFLYIQLVSFLYGWDDFCLITGFRFGKVNLDPDEKNHYEFRMRVFPKIENLKGEHLLELVNKDVKYAKLDDEDVVRVCLLLASDFVFMGHELRHVVSKPIIFYSKNSTVNKLILSAIEMNEFRWRSSLDYFKKVTHSIPVLRSATKDSSKVEEKLKPGPSDVDHLDKTDNLSKNAHDCGLDQQSMGGVSQCMNVDEPYKIIFMLMVLIISRLRGSASEYESVIIDGLISLRSQDVGHLSKKSFVIDSPQFKVKDNKEACHSDFCLSTQQVQDACVSELLDVVKDDVNVNSVVKEEIVKDDVNVNTRFVSTHSVVKDAEQIENETLPRQKFPGKVYLFPYIQPASTEVKCRKMRREIKLEKDVTRSPTAPKRTVTVPEEVNALFHDKNRMEMRWTFPCLGCPPNRIESRLFWLDLREKLQFQILLFLDNAEVFEKKNIVKEDYSISFQFADGVPIHGCLYSDCRLWVCIFLYSLSHNIPLEVDDPISFALAYHEGLIEFY